MIKSKKILMPTLLSGLFFLSACVSSQGSYSKLEKTTQLALCVNSPEMLEFEKQILVGKNYRRITKHSFSPKKNQTLFGHKIRVINLESNFTKLYVAGNPTELAYVFKQVLPNISCKKRRCEAKINEFQTLTIRKSKSRKTKNTTVIKCTKPKQEKAKKAKKAKVKKSKTKKSK